MSICLDENPLSHVSSTGAEGVAAFAPASALERHLLERLDGVTVHNEPFSHLYITEMFPAEFYPDLLQALPAPSDYAPISEKHHRLPDGTCARGLVELNADGLAGLDEPRQTLWGEVCSALQSSRVKSKLFTLLSVDLAYRFDIPPARCAEIVAWPKPALCRDVTGYEIPPHPDGRKKIVTMQLFLPRDDSQQDLGTALYERRLISPRGLWNWQGRFRKVKQFPFLPNSGYAFAVNNTLRKKSWHGRERLRDGAGARNTLFNIYYADANSGY